MKASFRRRLRRTAFAAAAVGGLVAASLAVADARWPFPSERLLLAAAPRVIDGGGELIALRVRGGDEQLCEPVRLEDMGRWLPMAIVAIEDERFRWHPGVDPRSVGRAAWVNLRSGRVREGASTITMQVVDLTLGTGRSFSGKAVEALRALQLERLLSKDEILEQYLNRIPVGGNLVGAAAGARGWFGKAPADLTLGEAALLAGLPQAPGKLRPDRRPDRAERRRLEVLDSMLVLGWITDEEHARAAAEPIPREMLVTRGVEAERAPHLAEWALARRAVGGETLIDPRLQTIAQELVQRHRSRLPRGADVALAIIDVEESALVAHVGSADHGDPLDGEVDGARALRSPGSALKPFLYAAALEAGLLRMEDELLDAPLEVDGWRPRNFEGGTSGEVTASEALRRSLNLPAIRVAHLAGMGRCVGVLESVGVSLPEGTAERSGLALATGATRVRLIDLVNGYATLARRGVRCRVRLFSDDRQGAVAPALSPATCEALWSALSDEARAPRVHHGASHVGSVGFMWKTGTSAGHADAWAVGHDLRFAAGVWVGRFDGAGDPAFVGAEVAEPILAELFAAIRD